MHDELFHMMLESRKTEFWNEG